MAAASLLLKRLAEIRKINFKNNERVAELTARRLGAYERWAEQIEIFLLVLEEIEDDAQGN